ncbi:ribonuclease P/MRP protein subunit POP3, partial [Tremellales sp. Uapishka_1]
MAARPQTLAKAHDAASSIRAQTKDQSGSKNVVKAVLASPLTVPWPNIPRHLQNTILHTLPSLIPPQIADYHVSRARSNQKTRSEQRKLKRAVPKEGTAPPFEGVAATETESSAVSLEKGKRKQRPVDSDSESNARLAKRSKTAPTKPDILASLVLGINEVVKALESQIEALKIDIIELTDRLSVKSSNLLPTAPAHETSPPLSSSPSSPIQFVVIPLTSINPQTMVASIPTYCATYNALVYQFNQLRKRDPKTVAEKGEVEEVRVVPLGDVEAELAAMVGLRRLACMAVRADHPEVQGLVTLLPKSILHPPRYSISIPFPTATLKLHDDNDRHGTRKGTEKKGPAVDNVPTDLIHYSPVHIKGIKTTFPVDASSKKATRLAEVRQKRVEAKEKKRGANGKGKGNGKKKVLRREKEKRDEDKGNAGVAEGS